MFQYGQYAVNNFKNCSIPWSMWCSDVCNGASSYEAMGYVTLVYKCKQFPNLLVESSYYIIVEQTR